MVVLAVPVLALLVAVGSPAVKAQPAKAPVAKAAAKASSKPVRPSAKAKPTTKRPAAKPKVVELFHINSKEKLRLRFVDESGRPVRDIQRRCDRFFRCHHTKKQGKMHPRLLRLLFAV